MNASQMIVLAALVAILVYCLVLKVVEAKSVHSHLASMLDEVQRTDSEEQLRDLRRSLITFRTRYCRSRETAEHADIVDMTIRSKLSKIGYSKI